MPTLTPTDSGDDASSSVGSGSASPLPVQPSLPALQSKAHQISQALPAMLKLKPAAATDAADEPLAIIPLKAAYTPARPGSSFARLMTKPLTSKSPIEAYTARPAISLSNLLNEKINLLAIFEAKFNDKILSCHKELMEEQQRSLEWKASADTDASLAEEVERLRDEIEEQKFSHEVEISLQKNKVEKLEEELQREKAWRGLAGTGSPGVELFAENDQRVEKMEQDLQREKDSRIYQLKSTEQLHFAEFRAIEKKHAEVVSDLVASYQKEIKILKKEMKAGCTTIETDGTESPGQQESTETTEAAAALSSLAAPSVAKEFSPPIIAETIDECSAVMVASQLPPTYNMVGNGTKPCLRGSEKLGGFKTGGRGKKRNFFSAGQSFSALKPNVSEISDSGSSSGDNEEPEKVGKKSRLQKKRQRDHVEDILRKAGKMPHAPAKYVPVTRPVKNEKKMLSEQAKEYLKAWMLSPEHCDHPYPTADEKAVIMADTGISFTELNNWFVNNRKRFWQSEVKPKITEIKKAHRMLKMKESYKSCCTTDDV